jgi:hypothetical protein
MIMKSSMLCMQEKSQFWTKSNITGSESGISVAALSVLHVFQAYQISDNKS